MALVGRQLGDERRSGTGRHRGILLALLAEGRVDVGDIRVQRMPVAAVENPRNRHVTSREHWGVWGDIGDHLDLEGLALEATGADRGKATYLRSEVRPDLRTPESRLHTCGARNPDRFVTVPRLLARLAYGWAQLRQSSGIEAVLRPVGVAFIRGLECHAPRATRRIRVRLQKPVAVELERTALELVAVQPPGRVVGAATAR